MRVTWHVFIFICYFLPSWVAFSHFPPTWIANPSRFHSDLIGKIFVSFATLKITFWFISDCCMKKRTLLTLRWHNVNNLKEYAASDRCKLVPGSSELHADCHHVPQRERTGAAPTRWPVLTVSFLTRGWNDLFLPIFFLPDPMPLLLISIPPRGSHAASVD